jgi:hypothetical protein
MKPKASTRRHLGESPSLPLLQTEVCLRFKYTSPRFKYITLVFKSRTGIETIRFPIRDLSAARHQRQVMNCTNAITSSRYARPVCSDLRRLTQASKILANHATCAPRSRDVGLRQEYPAGEKVFIDWAGPTIPRSTAVQAAKPKKRTLFVSGLGVSCYTYAGAFTDEQTINWLTAHIHAPSSSSVACPKRQQM